VRTFGSAGWGLVLVATVAGWLITSAAWAADADAVRGAIGEMMAASRAMIDSGERRDSERMVAEAERLREAGARALEVLPRPGNRHARDAADHVRQAMDHARRAAESSRLRRFDEAVTEARNTLTQVRRGAGHADAL
jgi:hypothetical protein